MIFGYFGGAANETDGRYTYHRFPEDLRTQEIYQYTVMPTDLRGRFTPDELSQATLATPFRWTKQVPLLKVPVVNRSPMYRSGLVTPVAKGDVMIAVATNAANAGVARLVRDERSLHPHAAPVRMASRRRRMVRSRLASSAPKRSRVKGSRV